MQQKEGAIAHNIELTDIKEKVSTEGHGKEAIKTIFVESANKKEQDDSAGREEKANNLNVGDLQVKKDVEVQEVRHNKEI